MSFSNHHGPTKENPSSSHSPQSYFPPIRASIPSFLQPGQYARQCRHAAQSSRLDPYLLHPHELDLLQHGITPARITNYLNIRNGILRLWIRNPCTAVTLDEAFGCAKALADAPLAKLAYEWLVRNGYINFGCVSIPPKEVNSSLIPPLLWQPRVVIVGAGMSGIACARQLNSLFLHYKNDLLFRGMTIPKIILLEGRDRIGGRIHSKEITPDSPKDIETSPEPQSSVVELGAQIVTGFERGNPMSPIARGQLGLDYHTIKNVEQIPLYDTDGRPDRRHDVRVDRLFNDILDRCIQFKAEPKKAFTLSGNVDRIDQGLDEDCAPGMPISDQLAAGKLHKVQYGGASPDTQPDLKPASVASAVRRMGWKLRDRQSYKRSIHLLPQSRPDESADLGSVFNSAILQYGDIIKISPRDLRVFNWHCANLEYSTAAPLSRISLALWDQDSGNEFEGPHANIKGGYGQIPFLLSELPNPLDIRKNRTVTSIKQLERTKLGLPGLSVQCSNGGSVEADLAVVTLPLGVLKSEQVEFQPPLPARKRESIKALGFGLMNKVVLVFDFKFWNLKSDAFGILQEPTGSNIIDQESYELTRGAFHIFWDCSSSARKPTLVSMMAGHAAEWAENESKGLVISLALRELQRVFGKEAVPRPSHAYVTAWGKDPFALGSYSYMSTTSGPDDYDVLAEPVPPLFFAGEATCGTHPATVHGAYISGLRAAAEVLERLIGPPRPLPAPNAPPCPTGTERKAPSRPSSVSEKRPHAPDSDIEAERKKILAKRRLVKKEVPINGLRRSPISLYKDAETPKLVTLCIPGIRRT